MRDIITIFGVNIDNVTEEESAQITKELIKESNKSCKLIVAPNVEFIMTAQKDKEFYDILKTAELATPDSVGVEMGGKVQGKPFKGRVPGQAYFRAVLKMAEKEGYTVYLLGGKDDIPRLAKENVERLFPNIKIVGYHEGFFVKDSEQDVIDEINRLQPNILFVATGHPRQEKWIYNHKNELKVDVATGQGGTFDYEAGNIKRAPKMIQKLGIEWLWRLILQPSRIKRMMVLPKYYIMIHTKKDITKSHWDN